MSVLCFRPRNHLYIEESSVITALARRCVRGYRLVSVAWAMMVQINVINLLLLSDLTAFIVLGLQRNTNHDKHSKQAHMLLVYKGLSQPSPAYGGRGWMPPQVVFLCTVRHMFETRGLTFAKAAFVTERERERERERDNCI